MGGMLVMDMVTFIWSVIASGTANTIQSTFSNIFSKKDIETLEELYVKKEKEKFEEYIDYLLKENKNLEEKLAHINKKRIFEKIKTVIGSDSDVHIKIETAEKEVSIGNESDIKVTDGGKFKFEYKG